MKHARELVIALPVILVLLAPVTALTVPPTPIQDLNQGPTDDDAYGRPVIDPTHTVARIWDEALLDAIRLDRPKPPVHARNLFHLSVAMWDAWAAYDPQAVGYVFTEKHTAVDVAAARNQAISHAAYRLLQYRFPGGGVDPFDGQPCQPGAATSLAEFDTIMLELGYDPGNTDTVGDSAAAIGNRIAQAVIAFGQADGAFEGFDFCYPDDTGYFPMNPELIFELPGTNVFDANRWQPLAFDLLVLQNGIIIGAALQSFVGVAWGDVASFANPPVPPGGTPMPTDCGSAFGAVSPIFDPGCPPQLGGLGDAELKEAVVELIRFSSYADPGDDVLINISPAVWGNNPLGTDDGAGHTVNPATCQPYPPNVVKRGDWARTLAEFWADGPESETPPGHWNTLANYVTDNLGAQDLRIAGTSDPVDRLEWEVKLYLALNGAVHDSAVAAWGTKHFYDSSRPITLIRHMGLLGQSTDLQAMSWAADGLPLVPGLIELITDETIAPGGRHEHLAAFCAGGGPATNTGEPCETDADCPDDGPFDGFCDSSVGKIAILAWQGEPADPVNDLGGVGWIRAIDWMPYQAANFVSPPFPGYTSGHSTFSRAGAEVLAAFTGDPYFPGGYGSFTAVAGEYLRFEDGPSETVKLQWATYADAADEAGISRRYGGIHPWYDDYPGRVQGADIGQAAFARALEFYNMDLTGDDDSDECSDDEYDDGYYGYENISSDQGHGGISELQAGGDEEEVGGGNDNSPETERTPERARPRRTGGNRRGS